MSAFINKMIERLLGSSGSHRRNFLAYTAVNGSLFGLGLCMLHVEVTNFGWPQQAAPYANTVPLWIMGYIANRYITCRFWQVSPREKHSGSLWYSYKAMEFLGNHGLYATFVVTGMVPYMRASLLATLLVSAPSYWIARWIFNPSSSSKEVANSVSPA